MVAPFVALAACSEHDDSEGSAASIEPSNEPSLDGSIARDARNASDAEDLSEGATAADAAGNLPDVEPCTTDGGCELARCNTDADCGSEYLVCRSSQVYLGGATSPVTLDVCRVRYEFPCQIDADCGRELRCNWNSVQSCDPATQTCTPVGVCEWQYKRCNSAAQCPDEWSCYATHDSSPETCNPPFAVFY
jgi:hypothetical protein